MSETTAERLPVSRPGSRTQDPTPLEELMVQLLAREKGHPLGYKELRREIARRIDNQPDGVVRSTLARLVGRDDVLEFGDDAYFLTTNLDLVRRRICEVMAAYHATYPYEPEMTAGEIKKRFSKGKTLNARRNIDPRLFDRAMAACRERGLVVEGAEGARLSEFSPSSAQQDEIRRLERAVLDYARERRYYQIDLADLALNLDVEPRKARAILARLLKAQELVRYGEDRYLEAAVVTHIKSTLAQELARASRLKIAEIKDLLEVPRNSLIPLMEWLDAIGFTHRDGPYRTLARSD